MQPQKTYPVCDLEEGMVHPAEREFLMHVVITLNLPELVCNVL